MQNEVQPSRKKKRKDKMKEKEEVQPHHTQARSPGPSEKLYYQLLCFTCVPIRFQKGQQLLQPHPMFIPLGLYLTLPLLPRGPVLSKKSLSSSSSSSADQCIAHSSTQGYPLAHGSLMLAPLPSTRSLFIQRNPYMFLLPQ